MTLLLLLAASSCGRTDLLDPLDPTPAPGPPTAPAATPQRCTPEGFAPFSGCGAIFVAGADPAAPRYLTVSVRRAEAGFVTGSRFEARASSPGVTIQLETYASALPPGDGYYCSDVAHEIFAVKRVKAVSGSLRVEVDNPEPAGPFHASVTVDDLLFDDGTRLCHVELPNVLVGWWPG